MPPKNQPIVTHRFEILFSPVNQGSENEFTPCEAWLIYMNIFLDRETAKSGECRRYQAFRDSELQEANPNLHGENSGQRYVYHNTSNGYMLPTTEQIKTDLEAPCETPRYWILGESDFTYRMNESSQYSKRNEPAKRIENYKAVKKEIKRIRNGENGVPRLGNPGSLCLSLVLGGGRFWIEDNVPCRQTDLFGPQKDKFKI